MLCMKETGADNSEREREGERARAGERRVKFNKEWMIKRKMPTSENTKAKNYTSTCVCMCACIFISCSIFYHVNVGVGVDGVG